MKRLAILLILTGSAYQLKAQQVQAKPADSLLKSIDKYLKPQTDIQNLVQPNPAFKELLALNDHKTNIAFHNETFRSNMPVVVLEGNSKMPIAKLKGYDNMPGAVINPEGTGILRQLQLPAFKAPAALSPAPQK